MTRYHTLRQNYDWFRMMELPHQLNVPAAEAVDTGLLTSDGVPIYRSPDAVGFVRDFSKPRVRVKCGRSVS